MISYGRVFIRKYDIGLFLTTLLLISVGLIMVYSTSAMSSIVDYGSSYHYILRQFLYAVPSVFIIFFLMKNDYHFLKSLNGILIFISIVALIMVFIPHIGLEAGGSRRWINLRVIDIEPSEFLKIVYVIYLANFLEKRKDILDHNKFSPAFISPFIFMGFLDILLLKQPDFGTVSILFFITFIMLFAGGISLLYLLIIFLIGSAGAYFLIFSVAYRRERILAFLHPFHDRTGIGFQIIQSIYAFGRGGLFGVGLGNGKEKLFFLPTPYSDFIFSTVGEELGFVGVSLFIMLYLFLAYRGLKIAMNAPDLFGTYLAYGLTALIVVSAFINIGVVMGSLPTKGLALPFVSYGGSAMLASCAAVGILLNISSQSVKSKGV